MLMNGAGQTSGSNPLMMLQEDFLSFREFSQEKMQKMEDKVDSFIVEMRKLMRLNHNQREENFDNLFGRPGKGVLGTPKSPETSTVRGDEDKGHTGHMLEPYVGRKKAAYDDEDDDLRFLKVSFPAYAEGDDARGWVNDCEEYFDLFKMREIRMVPLAAMHLRGAAKSWYNSYIVGKGLVTWEEFSVDFVIKFTEAGQDSVFEQFKMLKQTGDLNNYLNEFERHRGLVLKKIPQMTEEYFVDNFIGGLREESRRMVKLLALTTLSQAFKQAKQFETTLPKPSSPQNRSKTHSLPYNQPNIAAYTTPTNKPALLTYPKQTTKPPPTNPKPITATQRDKGDRKAFDTIVMKNTLLGINVKGLKSL